MRPSNNFFRSFSILVYYNTIFSLRLIVYYLIIGFALRLLSIRQYKIHLREIIVKYLVYNKKMLITDLNTTILQQCQENFFKVLGNSETPWQPWQSTRAPPAAQLIKAITAYVPSLDRRPFLVRINQVKAVNTGTLYKLEKLFWNTSLWSILVSSFMVAKDQLHR